MHTSRKTPVSNAHFLHTKPGRFSLSFFSTQDAKAASANGELKKKNGLVHRARPVGREAPEQVERPPTHHHLPPLTHTHTFVIVHVHRVSYITCYIILHVYITYKHIHNAVMHWSNLLFLLAGPNIDLFSHALICRY